MNVGQRDALKSIPRSKSIATLLSLTNHGTNGAVSGQSPAKLDFKTLAEYHEGLLRVQLVTTGGAGATPTAVGAGVTFRLWYAFSDDDISTNDIVNTLQTSASSLLCALPNANSVQASGTITVATLPGLNEKVFIGNGTIMYPYNWINSGLLDLNAAPFNVATGVDINTAASDLNAAIAQSGYPSPAYSTGITAPNSLVTGTVSTNVVTVKAVNFGDIGNAITLAKTGANVTVSGANLTGGSSAGTRQYATDPFAHGGRFLYTWFDRDAFAVNGQINATAKLIRL